MSCLTALTAELDASHPPGPSSGCPVSGIASYFTTLSTGFLLDTLLVIAAFVPIIYHDLRHRKIPDVYVISCAAIIALRRLAFEFPSSIWFLLCGLLGFGFIFLFRLFTRKIGLGDAKLSGLIALWLGLTGWLIALLAASLAGIAYAAVRIQGKAMPRTARIPFASFPGLGAVAGFTFNAFFGKMFDEYLWEGLQGGIAYALQ